MDRGAWQATIHGVARVGHDLATKEREKIEIDCLSELDGGKNCQICHFTSLLINYPT